MSVRLLAVALLAAACTSSPPTGSPDAATPDDQPAAGACAMEKDFATHAWPEVFARCVVCHVAGGVSGGTRFVLKPLSVTGALHQNFETVHRAATGLTEGDVTLLLLKPTGTLPHGGGTVIPQDGADYATLVDFVKRTRDPVEYATCASTLPASAVEKGVVLLDPARTLRKASLQLAGRLPTDAELAAVARDDPATLPSIEPVLRQMMTEEPFYTRVKEMFNDVLLTSANALENTYGGLAGDSVPAELRLAACDPTEWQNFTERTNTADSRMCLDASDGLSREPLEMIAHVVRENRPFTEVLTAQYRYLNGPAAKVLGVDSPSFTGHVTDREFFHEVRIPAMHGPDGNAEEYAGVLTTSAFLYRYNSTGTNRNRARSYWFYKLFLGVDVMKNTARLDLSSVDFAQSPWRNNIQCTGCHATIDPVAGAFQHWTNCYDIAQVRYYSTRYCPTGPWFPESDMFPPGAGPGASQTFSSAEVPTALVHLTDATIHDPAFARTMAAHVFVGLTGHELLEAPTDTSDPKYDALDLAYEDQRKVLDALGKAFADSGFDFKALVVAVVKSRAFRAGGADVADRAELEGMGGGVLTAPEVLHRKIAATMGAPWSLAGALTDPEPHLRDPPYPLLSLMRYRIFAGGIDAKNVRHRARLPGAMTAAVATRLALEMSCAYVPYDFALDRAARQLFPDVDRTLIPSGNAGDSSQAPILATLRRLHARLLGETLAADDPELLETYQLLVDLRTAGKAAITAGTTTTTLPETCRATVNPGTGVALPVAKQFSDDPEYVVRAWQGVLTYLLTDYRFLFED